VATSDQVGGVSFSCLPDNKRIGFMIRPFLLLFLLIIALTGCRADTAETAGIGLDRAIQNKGSDTMVNLALA
jgi:hypothetical protein